MKEEGLKRWSAEMKRRSAEWLKGQKDEEMKGWGDEGLRGWEKWEMCTLYKTAFCSMQTFLHYT